MSSKIRSAAASRDAGNVAEVAHALKGMLASFCAEPAQGAARELEMMGREERLTDVDTAIARVKDETARLTEALHQFLRTKTK